VKIIELGLIGIISVQSLNMELRCLSILTSTWLCSVRDWQVWQYMVNSVIVKTLAFSACYFSLPLVYIMTIMTVRVTDYRLI